MDRHEASKKFAVLGNPDTLKIVKMTLNHGPMDLPTLAGRLGVSEAEAKKAADAAVEAGLVAVEGNVYGSIPEVVDALMAFVRTPCGCCHH